MTGIIPSYNLYCSGSFYSDGDLVHLSSHNSLESLALAVDAGENNCVTYRTMSLTGEGLPECRTDNGCPNAGDALALDLGFKKDYLDLVVMSVTNTAAPGNSKNVQEFIECSLLQDDELSLGWLEHRLPGKAIGVWSLLYLDPNETLSVRSFKAGDLQRHAPRPVCRERVIALLDPLFYNIGDSLRGGCFDCLLNGFYSGNGCLLRRRTASFDLPFITLTAPWLTVRCASVSHSLEEGCKVETLSHHRLLIHEEE